MKKIKKEDFPSRLRQIMNDRNISQAELSKITGITASSISDWLNRKYDAKQDKIDKIASSLNISPAWLLGYDVPMDKNIIDKSDPSTITETIPSHFSTAKEAMNFMLNQAVVMGFNGLDITKLSEEEQIQYANDMLEMMKLVSLKYKDKK